MSRLSSLPLPPYAFLPGLAPHPKRDPAGHHVLVDAALPPDEVWPYAIDLYNLGYFFEAHVAFEQLWRAAPPASFERAALQALVKLAGALLKLRLGNEAAARRLAERAASLLERVAVQAPVLWGLELRLLARLTREQLCEATVVSVADRPPLSVEPGP